VVKNVHGKLRDLVENVGSGLKRIRDTMKENGLAEPVIEADEHWFTVTFHRERAGRPTSSPDVEEPATTVKTTVKIIRLIETDNHITMQSLCGQTGLSRRGIEWNLLRLKESGIIRRVGPDKGGHWEIVEK
jgi:ATP-dependent DNA helicase RecG